MPAPKDVSDFLLNSHPGLADLALWVREAVLAGEPAAVPSSKPSRRAPRMSGSFDIPKASFNCRDGQGRLAPSASRTKRSLVDPVTTHMHATAPVGEQQEPGLPWLHCMAGSAVEAVNWCSMALRAS